MEELLAIVTILIMIGMYLLPAIVAGLMNHPHFAGILILTIFLGWTGFAWVIALVWAVTQPQQQQHNR